MKFGLTLENLRAAERTIIHPDTYKRVKVSEVSPDIVGRADDLAIEDEEFRLMEQMKGMVSDIIL